MTSLGILGAVWRHRVLVIAVILVEFVVIGLGLALGPRQYTADATVLAAPSSELLQSSGNLASLQASLGPLATSRAVLQEVARNIAAVRSIDELNDSVSAALVPGTALIHITAVESDPQIAAEVANAVAEALPDNAPQGDLFKFMIAERAAPPTSFSSPNVPIVVLVGIALSIVLAVVSALIRDRTSRRVVSPEEVESATNAGVLAKFGYPKDPSTLPAIYAGTPAASAFRQLRVSLELEGRDEDMSTLVIAGSCSCEVDGWLSSNLAIALAQVGHRVAIVDGDLSGRTRHPMLDCGEGLGLFDVLRGTPLDDALMPGVVDNLSVLPAGKSGSEQSDALMEMRFRDIIQEMNKSFDIVIVLAPPPMVSDDLRVIAAGRPVMLAVQAGKGSPKSLRDLTEGLHYVGANLIGSVLIANSRRKV